MHVKSLYRNGLGMGLVSAISMYQDGEKGIDKWGFDLIKEYG